MMSLVGGPLPPQLPSSELFVPSGYSLPPSNKLLQLSMDKTVILYTAQGTSAASILGKYRIFIDDLLHLVIPIGQLRTPLKAVTEHKYLGAMLSYKNFELSNLRHRLSVMWGTRTSSGALSQSTSWVLFAGTAPPLSVPSIAAVATQWNKEQKEAPSKIKAPLRVIMFQCFVQEWRLALERLESDPDFKAEAIRLEVLSASGDLPYLRWNSQTMRAEVLTDKSPLTVNEVVLMLKELTVLSIADGTITRFHPTRRFSEDMMGPTVTFRLELGLREVKTFRFWQILETLSANSALRLVASSSRRERMTRSRWPRASHQL
eukprot:s2784_g6.t1